MSPTPKKIRSQPADVTIVVGHGDAMQEFEAYKVVLSFASPYFDAILSTNMKEGSESRIEFPRIQPYEWEMFYECIDPTRMSEAKQNANITEANVGILTPLFHLFQMDSYLRECDQVHRDKLRAMSGMVPATHIGGIPRPINSFWDISSAKKSRTGLANRKITFSTFFQVLENARLYGLEQTKKEIEGYFCGLLEHLPLETQDLWFKTRIIEVIVELVLPLAEKESKHGHKRFESGGESTVLWDYLKGRNFEQTYLRGLSLDTVNSSEVLQILVESHVRQCATVKAARNIIKDSLDNAPREMRNRTSFGKELVFENMRDVVSEQYEKHQLSFKTLGISQPDFDSEDESTDDE